MDKTRLTAEQWLRVMPKELSQLPGTTLVAVVFSFAIAVVVADSLRSWYRLSHVPGPFWAAISKYWLVSHSLKGRQPYAIQEANDKYGEQICPIIKMNVI